MTPLDILQPHYQDGAFTQFIVQMFVETNNTFNYTFFNKFYETSFTHSAINSAILELSGSKVIKFRELTDLVAFELFKNVYRFGTYPNVRAWISHMHNNYNLQLARIPMLLWVATQRPDKVVGSFLPTNDRNIYNDTREEKSS